MRIRDKIITAACRDRDGIEWTSLRIKQDGPEPAGQSSLAFPLPDVASPAGLDSLELPAELAEHLKGDITVALRTSELLMRTMEFPAADDKEIAEMTGFQIDKVSPFPLDQMALAHELLERTEDRVLVLMAAAKHEAIDAIGDLFEKKGVRIHSIDARILGWLRLVRDAGELPEEGCHVLIVDDGLDFSLVILMNGKPMAFRSLHAHLGEMNVIDDLSRDISYTLTTLDSERELPAPSSIAIWSFGNVPSALQAKLSGVCGVPVRCHALGGLPPLSEGILRRTMDGGSHIELIPREWIEHEQWQQLSRKFTRIAAGIAAVWLVVSLAFFGVFKARDIKLASVQKQADAIAPVANQALENRQKLKALKVYTDRSDSALECLREVVRVLPVGDIEFNSYNYTKGKGVTLRGTAASDDAVYEFFKTLSDSKLFKQLKDQSVNTKTSKDIRRAVFSATLELPATEDAP